MKVYAIGDIHGELGLLTEVVEWIERDSEGHDYCVVTLGDYVDRGPQSAKVVDLLMQKTKDPRWVALAGNHEDIMLRALGGSDRWADVWVKNGGANTASSYMRLAAERGFEFDRAVTTFPEHIEWMKNLPLMHVIGDKVFVHADVDPAVPLTEQSSEVVLWSRRDHSLWEKPMSHEGKSMLIVHGHTPSRRHPAYVPGISINLDTGACGGGRLTCACWTDDEKHPRIFQVNNFMAAEKHWDEVSKTWVKK